jgi:hypothetical protein
MMFSVGTRVQAIDQIGRWENGRILCVAYPEPEDKNDDAVAASTRRTSRMLKVRFDGDPGGLWDLDYQSSDIRLPIVKGDISK